MIYKIIIFLAVSGIAGTKKPIYGGLAGLIAAPIIFLFFNYSDFVAIAVISVFGFAIGFLWSVFVWNLFHNEEYNQQNIKTYVMPMNQPGSGQRGGLIYTDEEEKNYREHIKK